MKLTYCKPDSLPIPPTCTFFAPFSISCFRLVVLSSGCWWRLDLTGQTCLISMIISVTFAEWYGWWLPLLKYQNNSDLRRFFFLRFEDKLTIGFDGRFCLKINAAISHLATDPCFLFCLQRRMRFARQLNVGHSFDGPCILILNYSVWDTEKFYSHKKLALI